MSRNGNSFLTHPHIAMNFRKELYFRDRKNKAWEATLSTEMVDEARKTAKRLLKEHQMSSIDRDVLREGNEMIREYEKALVV